MERNIDCSSCGATLSNEDLKGLQCPYCGSKIEKTIEKQSSDKLYKSGKLYKYDEIISFIFSEEDARESLAWTLANEMEVPIEVFDNLGISVKKAYIPMWRFDGSFKSPWSCQKVVWRSRTYKEDGKTKYETYKEYYPANGVAVGNFSLFISGGDRDYGLVLPVPSADFSPEMIDSDAVVKDLVVSREKAWKNDLLESHIELLATLEMKKTLPEEYEDLNSYYEYRSNYCTCVLYPIYEVEFYYEGEIYENVVSGCTGGAIRDLECSKTGGN